MHTVGRRRSSRGERTRGDPFDVQNQRPDVAVAVRMDAVAEEQDEDIELRVDQQRRAGETAVRVGARAEPAGAPVAGRGIPAERAGAARHRLGHGDRSDDARGEHASPVNLALTEHHSREPGEVVGRREEPRVARHAAETERARVVDVAPDDHVPALDGSLRRRDALKQRGGRAEAGVGHPEGLEDLVPLELVEWVSRHVLGDRAEQDVADVAVSVPAPWARLEVQIEDPLERGRGPVVVVRSGVDGGEAARVQEELAHRDGGLAGAPEVGDVARDGRVE